MATRFIVGCGTVTRDEKGRFLLVRQMGGYWKGQWIFPGGKLELGETLEQCARREFKEETGCDINIKRQIGAYTSYDPHTELEKQVVLIYFLGNGLIGNPSAGEGVTDTGWFTLAEIETMAKNGQTPELILKVAKAAIK
ncbi:Putative ADP-ribose pyrophosphatase [Methanocella conradii HZ254]|uniref:ADP-ribose pyrophosphatase n=1 Tax=Methanocella conradii (strain DSM 24694 / JCM 17849 / CGMCC 1.5162 / HZ254) TaxID=1041930 RepID=H8I9Z7_METCZ|nr:NUDIX domain-containing protein [Methanocella conradii]AFD00957.1 Putative ADP-ribose pyrophosphatase [Methanocella conradii HZ254]MDI6897695.1 NUDIX domain-containing protein [Methanocella conradii]